MHLLNKGLKFDRNQILNRYWDLADLDPEKTKGNILGQLKALDSLCEELAAGDKPRSSAKPNPRAGHLPRRLDARSMTATFPVGLTANAEGTGRVPTFAPAYVGRKRFFRMLSLSVSQTSGGEA